MTNPKKPKKFLALNNARIYPNRDSNTFNLIGSTDEIPDGFMITLPHGTMADKIREFFQKSGVAEPQQTDDAKLPKHAHLFYGAESKPVADPTKRRHEHILHDSTHVYDDVMGKVITVTSTKGGAGKTSTAVMLASTFSSATNKDGRRLKTVVVDCDINDPGLADLFAPEYTADVLSFKDIDYAPNRVYGVPGVVDLMMSRTGFEGMTDEDFLKNLVFSNSLGVHLLFNRHSMFGKTSQDPAFYRAVIERLKKHFDVVIIDTGGWQQNLVSTEVAFPMADKIVLVQHETKIIPYIQRWTQDNKNFPDWGLSQIDLSKVAVIAVSPFGADVPGKRFEPIEDENGKEYILGGYMFGMSGFDPLEFLGKIPLDTIAVQHAANSGQFADLLKHHPYFSESFRQIASNLFADDIVLNFDPEPEESTVSVQTANDEHVLIGVRPNGRALAIDFVSGPADNGVSPSIFISHEKDNDPALLIENLMSFLKFKREGKEVITYGLAGEYDGAHAVQGNLEFLSVLRSLANDVQSGKDVSDKVLFFGDSEISKKQYDSLQDRVDKAVMAEIYALISTDLMGAMQFVFVSAKPNTALNTLATASENHTRIHFGAKRRNPALGGFMEWAFGKDVTSLSTDWPKGRAYVKAPNYTGLIQAFEVKG